MEACGGCAAVIWRFFGQARSLPRRATTCKETHIKMEPVAAPPAVPDEEITIVPLSFSLANLNAPVSYVGTPPPGYTATDLSILNDLAHDLLLNPNQAFPPPPQTTVNPRSQKGSAQKDAGNTHFRKGEWQEAIKYYTLAAETAATRPLYESNLYARDEIAIALCNRSAAYLLAGEFVNALVDADAVVALKRPWVKGYFRKGKALQAMGRWEEAREALLLGLQFDPSADVSFDFFTPERCHELTAFLLFFKQDLATAVAEVEAIMRQRNNQAKLSASE